VPELEGVRESPARVVVYASMSPRARASDEVLMARQRALWAGQTCTHWPWDLSCLEAPAKVGQRSSDQLPHASGRHKNLVGFTNAQISRWLQSSEEDNDDNDNEEDLTGFASPRPITLVDDVTADEQAHGTWYRVHLGGAEGGGGYREQPEGHAWPQVQQIASMTASCPHRARLREYRPSARRPREK